MFAFRSSVVLRESFMLPFYWVVRKPGSEQQSYETLGLVTDHLWRQDHNDFGKRWGQLCGDIHNQRSSSVLTEYEGDESLQNLNCWGSKALAGQGWEPSEPVRRTLGLKRLRTWPALWLGAHFPGRFCRRPSWILNLCWCWSTQTCWRGQSSRKTKTINVFCCSPWKFI